MCGIFGYVGVQQAQPILIAGLRTLEYRGYDSAGIFLPESGSVKAVGPIDNLAAKITGTLPGTSGIAHTRWATHGAPSEANAHPHMNEAGALWLVHNGIIENYRELKEESMSQGVSFYSETDTEVLVKLISSLYAGDILLALRSALQKVRGTYGIAVMDVAHPHEIAVARMGSPIVLGIMDDGHLVASDASALLAYTKDVVYLNDGDIALLKQDAYSVTSVEGVVQDRAKEKILWNIDAVQKNGYDHFLLKEIIEIPDTVANTIRGRLLLQKGRVKLGGLDAVATQLRDIQKLLIVGCGSAVYAGHVGKNMLEEYGHLSTDVELGSEFRYRTATMTPGTALLAVTQSGETADTLASLRKAKDMGLTTLGMVNVVGSTIAREVDAGIYNYAGPEVSIASTKAFVSQLTAFVLLSVYMGRDRGMSLSEGVEITRALKNLPQYIQEILTMKSAIEAIAVKYATYTDMVYIGRGYHAPIAYEGALKLKEVTYIHAEAYAGGELKHGPIAMLDADFPVIALVPEDAVYEKMISNIQEIKARGVPVIAVTTQGAQGIETLVDDCIYIPKVHPIIQPILSVIPLQLFAYYVGVAKGLNVDRPRNLAKSVTVE